MLTTNAGAIIGLPAQQSGKIHFYLRSRRFWTLLLYVSGGLGVSAGLIGLIFSLASLSGLAGSQITFAGTILIVVAFPLLMVTGHCLDKIREAEKAIRLEYCRQNGLRDKDC